MFKGKPKVTTSNTIPNGFRKYSELSENDKIFARQMVYSYLELIGYGDVIDNYLNKSYFNIKENAILIK